MKSVLLRTCSTPVQCYRTISHTTTIPSFSTISFRSEYIGFDKMKRSNSDTDLIKSKSELIIKPSLHRRGSVSFPGLGTIVDVDGAGIGNGNENGNGGNNNNNDGNIKMEEYYQEMLKSNPGDSLLLRNYGKYLHEVEKNMEKVEEYYGRAILASPGDGELLSLYGNLIWETSKDEDRAQLTLIKLFMPLLMIAWFWDHMRTSYGEQKVKR